MQAQPAVARTAASDIPDKEIAQRIATGDRSALVALMRRYNQKLYRTARSILGDDAEAEDASQDAWFHAWRAIGEFRADAALSTWLVRIAANEALGRLRKRKRRADVIWLGGDRAQHDGEEDPQMSEASEGPFDPPERAAMRTQMRELIEAAIDRRDLVQRRVLDAFGSHRRSDRQQRADTEQRHQHRQQRACGGFARRAHPGHRGVRARGRL